jgi:HD-like signal output (HDOD) protein
MAGELSSMTSLIVLKFFPGSPDYIGMEASSRRSLSHRSRLLQSLNKLPPFSPVVNQLIAGLANEHVHFAELAQWVEKDTVIAGHVLRTVNSALYALPGTISSIPHAIAILGRDKLRNAVLALSLARMWRHEPGAKTWSTRAFSLHSAATGALADLLAQLLPVDYAEGAFAAGLFHDVGKLLAAIALPVDYDLLCESFTGQQQESKACEEAIFGISHSELSALAVAYWKLPAAVQQAVRQHHTPEGATSDCWPLSKLVSVADLCVNSMQICIAPTVAISTDSPEQCLSRSGVPGNPGRLVEELLTELELLQKSF